ncbi:transglutaminase family protein [Neorhizobium petrolearium]|uniref:transglutaminase family protein n=1 Tax=Neorhizobium petrolearium TaxID=515361 RepID=UPI003F7F8A0D
MMRSFSIAIIILLIPLTAALAQSPRPDPVAVQRQVEALFEPSRDLLNVKLAVDAMVDPSVNTTAVRSMIDRMAAEISAMAGKDADSTAKLDALKRYLYESGPWNDNRSFQYDLDDPLGEKPANRLLQRYLTMRRGNCITMPILFLVLGQRIGLTMTLAEAPLHVFVKYTDEDGKVWNLEATSGGGFTRDAWYRRKLPMSDRAVANGVYLRALSHEEATALIAAFLIEDHIAKGEFESVIAVSDVLLRHYPNFAYGLVKKGSAYSGLLRRELAGKYTRMDDVPPEMKAKADQWYGQNMEAFAKAESLGWRPQDGQIE